MHIFCFLWVFLYVDYEFRVRFFERTFLKKLTFQPIKSQECIYVIKHYHGYARNAMVMTFIRPTSFIIQRRSVKSNESSLT